MPSLLKELGISSPHEAAELERDLGIRFNDLTPEQCRTWKQQTVYLGLFAQTHTHTHATRGAGVTVRTVKTWQTENTLGFNNRLELAVLEYSEEFDLILLQHARRPDCSPSLLMMFVRAQFPEKYGPARRGSAPSQPNHCDHHDHDPQPPATSRYDLQLMEEIFRDLQTLKNFAGLSEPAFTPPYPNPELSPTADGDPTHSDLSPAADGDPTHTNLSPAGGETQRGGTPPTNDPTYVGADLKSAPTSQHPTPGNQNPKPSLNRQQRRELQRRANRQKSHLARAPN